MTTNERVESVLAGVRPLSAADHGEMNEFVLVVEADSTLRRLLAQRLRLAGFTPVSARNWAEALHLIQLGTDARLIFLGPSLPLTQGCSEPDFAHIPMIALPSTDPCGALASALADYGYGALRLGDGQGAVEALTDTPSPEDVIIPSCSTGGCPIRETCTGSRGSGSCLLDARAF